MRTQQEIFDFVVVFLARQGRRSRDKDGNCRYRAPNGARCAIGALIPDSHYHFGLEGCGISNLVDRGMNTGVPEINMDNLDFLSELQLTHDFSASLDEGNLYEFKKNFSSVANEYGLSTTVLDSIQKLGE